MLYDPKWERKTDAKADPLLLVSLIAWLEQQPAGQTYGFFSNRGCLVAQYLLAMGVARSTGGWTFQPIGGGDRVDVPQPFNDVAYPEPRTFGAALERARAIHASTE